jgi:hypothetical protein
MGTLVVGSLLVGSQAKAVPVVVDEQKGIAINVGILAQPWFQTTTNLGDGAPSPGIGAPDGDSPSFDFFVRRARLMSWGSITKELSYFIETDQPNIGRGGNFIQDVFLTYQFAPELKIDAGMMLVPLSHHTIEGAVGLNAIDYHTELIRFPAGLIFRDTGIQLRGLLFGGLLHYRAAVFEGVRNSAIPVPAMPPPTPLEPVNEAGLPRFTGHVRLNLMGEEPDFFLRGIYFTPTPLVSVGVGVDFQPDAVRKLDGDAGAYLAFSADLFLDYPFSEDDELIIKANVFNYAEGSSAMPSSSALPTGGTAFYVEAGFRHAWFEPLAYVEYLRAQDDALTILSPHVGVNFWIQKHTFNIKADVGYRRTERPVMELSTTFEDLLGTVQGQVFF